MTYNFIFEQKRETLGINTNVNMKLVTTVEAIKIQINIPQNNWLFMELNYISPLVLNLNFSTCIT